MASFEIYSDSSNRYRWRMTLDTGENVAHSGQGYNEKDIAIEDVEKMQRFAAEAEWVEKSPRVEPPADRYYFEYYTTPGGSFRWRLKTPSSEIISSSPRGYESREQLFEILDQLRNEASTAIMENQTGGGEGDPLFDLGELPSGFVINWPALPDIIRSEEVSSVHNGGNLRIDQSNSEYRVEVGLQEIIINASDVSIEIGQEVRVDRLYITRSCRRISIQGGEVGQIEMAVPKDFTVTPPVSREEWLVEDVVVEGVTLVNEEEGGNGSTFLLRGKRIAVLRCQVNARDYSVWIGDTDDFQSEDIILAGNVFISAGPQATIRLVSVNRSAVVHNHLENPLKHNYRVHGHSDQAFAARNIFLYAGLMIADNPEQDEVGSVWFNSNVLYHRTPSLLVLDNPLQSRLQEFHATGNIIFSEIWDCFLCNDDVPNDWVVEDNKVFLIK